MKSSVSSSIPPLETSQGAAFFLFPGISWHFPVFDVEVCEKKNSKHRKSGSGQRQQGKKLCRIPSGKDGDELERQAKDCRWRAYSPSGRLWGIIAAVVSGGLWTQTGEIHILPRSRTGTVYPLENPRRGLYRGSHNRTDKRQAHTRRQSSTGREKGRVPADWYWKQYQGWGEPGLWAMAKIHNLKQAAKTLNFLTEHQIEQYADLVSRIEEVTAASEQASNALKSM